MLCIHICLGPSRSCVCVCVCVCVWLPCACSNTDTKTHWGRLHGEIAQALTELGIAHEVEAESPDNLFNFDILVKQESQPDIVIEVDGPSHFAALPPYRPLGSTCIRNRLIDAAGHKGIAIPFYQWDKLQSRQAQLIYLQRRLDQVWERQMAPSGSRIQSST